MLQKVQFDEYSAKSSQRFVAEPGGQHEQRSPFTIPVTSENCVMLPIRGNYPTCSRSLRAVFHLAEFSAWNDIFFCLLTPTLRQLVFKQKKMSLGAEKKP